VGILWIKVNRTMSKLLTQSAEISEFPPESSQIVEVVFLVDLARFRCQLFLDEVENGISQLEFTKKIALDFQNTLHLVTKRQFVYVVVMETLSNRGQTNSAKFKIFTTERGQIIVKRAWPVAFDGVQVQDFVGEKGKRLSRRTQLGNLLCTDDVVGYRTVF
jgi:hypothetical protein